MSRFKLRIFNRGLGLSVLAVPTISGDAKVGQRLYAVNGTYSSAPDSYAGQWYKDAAAISGETGDNYLVVDGDVGSVFAYKEMAAKAGYTNSSLNTSANTAAVTDIDLTSAITAFTRTSASGVTPMTFSITFGANGYTGYDLRVRVYSDSALTTLLQDVVHTLTSPDIAGGALDLASDGLTAIGATDWMQVAVQTTSPSGNYYSYTFATALTPTDASVPMTWSTTDKSGTMALSGGNLVASSAASLSSIRSSRGIASGNKVYVEMVGGFGAAAVADASANLGAWWDSANGGAATTHASGFNINDQCITYNGSDITSPHFPFSPTDVIGIALDTVASPPTVSYYAQNVFQGSRTLTSISLPIHFACQLPNGKAATLYPGTTPGGTAGFTYTPPTGFVAP